ncbi:hypothetical protein NDU88_006531 [Pleurodeles waltl]|uniref:Uncharacterized protein n=1 Tax=Pleurodeles waltl TaxID=8319 RepID=A0AAV7WFX5_PLEWA|nr:hypothetical protein NDU88_006531 [Pleurodeles waltl]
MDHSLYPYKTLAFFQRLTNYGSADAENEKRCPIFLVPCFQAMEFDAYYLADYGIGIAIPQTAKDLVVRTILLIAWL